MDQIISALEERIELLIEELTAAHEEIERLRTTQQSTPITQNESQATTSPQLNRQSASLDLLAQLPKRSTEDQLQLYIEESLDLLPPNLDDGHSDGGDALNQMSFDLGLDTMTTPTTHLNQSNEPMTQETLTPVEDSSATNEIVAQPDLIDVVAEQESNTTETASPAVSAEQKRRQKNQKNNRRLIRMLEERYPKAFDWNNPRPLKVGIDKDMQLDDNFNASKQKRALAAYTRSDRYKKCLQSGQPRIDLEGTPVSNEPALPNVAPAPTKTRPEAKRIQPKLQDRKPNKKPKTAKAQPKAAPKQDDPFSNLSADERMKAKLEKLLGKH